MRELLWLQAIRDFYGLGPEVNLENHLVTRSTENVDRPKRLYYIGPGTPHRLHAEPASSAMPSLFMPLSIGLADAGPSMSRETDHLITC